ncbi:hypothetical protein [Methylocystis bryophila]|uniref:Uncharacterized protein n=1 Tax=Methylocystis bryophila TaxID=655015 RepID=A0A1W6MT58_9HYPH|nr:hypothetical protein [Methylocystis bryophila]ARN80679.1 hypothetical protein B1812_05880 [Methylocystis bryophila]
MGGILQMATASPVSAASALAGPAISLAGGLMNYGGARAAGTASYNAGLYSAMVAANNAVLENRQAGMTMEAGEVAASNRGFQVKQQVNQEQAQQGGAGIDSSTGSAVAVRAGTKAAGMADALNIRSNAANQAYAEEVQATSDQNQANLDVMAARNAKKAARIQALTGLLNSVSTAGTQFSHWEFDAPPRLLTTA